ncbi:hypothetical protein, partial [Streptomyces sp. NPDC002343]
MAAVDVLRTLGAQRALVLVEPGVVMKVAVDVARDRAATGAGSAAHLPVVPPPATTPVARHVPD